MVKMSLYSELKYRCLFILPLLFIGLSACDSNHPVDENGVFKVVAPLSNPVAESPSEPTAKVDSVDVLLDGLRSRLEAQPDDLEGWVLLAKSYQYLGQSKESKQAFSRARELGYTDAEIDVNASASSENTPQPRKNSSYSSSFSREPVYQLMEEVLADEAPQKKR